jgi:uncharacterized protein YbaA (DUF1428 family)
MTYADGFLLVVPKKKLSTYLSIAKKAGKVWRDHGALEYRECTAEDMKVKCGIPFPKRAGAKSTDVVVFSWIVYKSRKHRDKVNAAVMADPRLAKICTMPMPFDMAAMSHGGFDVAVDA